MITISNGRISRVDLQKALIRVTRASLSAITFIIYPFRIQVVFIFCNVPFSDDLVTRQQLGDGVPYEWLMLPDPTSEEEKLFRLN